jgi:hypothetical protein
MVHQTFLWVKDTLSHMACKKQVGLQSPTSAVRKRKDGFAKFHVGLSSPTFKKLDATHRIPRRIN